MPALLLFLASLNWTYCDDQSVKGWFGAYGEKYILSIYWDKNSDAFAIVHFSHHPRERTPLALVVDKTGFRVQERAFHPDVPPTLAETMQ